MEPGAFFVGLILFVAMAIGIRYVVVQQLAEARKETVPDDSIAILTSGEILPSNVRYLPEDLRHKVSLDPRFIQAWHDGGKHGVRDFLQMQAVYWPDPARLRQFGRALAEAGTLTTLDSNIGNAIAGKLCMAKNADFSDLPFGTIELAFGVKIGNAEGTPRAAVLDDKERQSTFDRFLQTETKKLKSRSEMFHFLANEEREAMKEPNLEVRQDLLDVIRTLRERIKLAD